jgi:hypothetical protein
VTAYCAQFAIDVANQLDGKCLHQLWLWRTLTGYLDFLKDPNFKCGFEFGLTLHMSTTRDLLACCHACAEPIVQRLNPHAATFQQGCFAGVGVVVGPAGRGGLDPYDKQNGTQHGKQGFPPKPNPTGFTPTNCATCARVRADPSVSLKPIKHKTTTVRAPHLVPTARRRFVHALACVLGYVSLCIYWSSYRDASSFLTAYGDASPVVLPGWAPPAKYLLNFCMDPPATGDVKILRFVRNQCHEPCSACSYLIRRHIVFILVLFLH